MSDYELFAKAFMAARDDRIGVEPVRAWVRGLAASPRILDLGCGHGVPIGRELASLGCSVLGVDTSETLLAAFRRNVPGASAVRADAGMLGLKPSAFDGVVAWGLLFLLEPARQEAVIHQAASALRPGGRMLATAPWQIAEWTDVLTGRRCVSLGRARYHQLFAGAGLAVMDEGAGEDEGSNYYWCAAKPAEPPGETDPG